MKFKLEYIKVKNGSIPRLSEFEGTMKECKQLLKEQHWIRDKIS